jgi:hypothetical protein
MNACVKITSNFFVHYFVQWEKIKDRKEKKVQEIAFSISNKLVDV